MVAYGNFFRFLFTDVSFFAVPTGFEPVPHTVTGWYCSHSTMKPVDSSIGFEPPLTVLQTAPLDHSGNQNMLRISSQRALKDSNFHPSVLEADILPIKLKTHQHLPSCIAFLYLTQYTLPIYVQQHFMGQFNIEVLNVLS